MEDGFRIVEALRKRKYAKSKRGDELDCSETLNPVKNGNMDERGQVKAYCRRSIRFRASEASDLA